MSEQLPLGLQPAMKPSLAKVYAMLRQAGPEGVTTGDFMRAYLASYSQRMGELKRLGVRIGREKLRDRATYRYWLEG